jgi:hypothetical protein
MAPKRSNMPAPVVALASWLVPGAGYVLIGQRGRGVTIGVTILALFVLGLLIGGMKVVEPSSDYMSAPLKAIMDKPWFIGQFLAGPISLIVANIAGGSGYLVTHSRINEIGTLYTAVAGMLNLLAVIDATSRAAQGEERE